MTYTNPAISNNITKALVFKMAGVSLALVSIGIAIFATPYGQPVYLMGFLIALVGMVVLCFISNQETQLVLLIGIPALFLSNYVALIINAISKGLYEYNLYGGLIILCAFIQVILSNVFLLFPHKKLREIGWLSKELACVVIILIGAFLQRAGYYPFWMFVFFGTLAKLFTYLYIVSQKRSLSQRAFVNEIRTTSQFSMPFNQDRPFDSGIQVKRNSRVETGVFQGISYYNDQQDSVRMNTVKQHESANLPQKLAGSSTEEKPLSERLQELKKLYAQELIDEDEYQTLRQRLLNEL